MTAVPPTPTIDTAVAPGAATTGPPRPGREGRPRHLRGGAPGCPGGGRADRPRQRLGDLAGPRDAGGDLRRRSAWHHHRIPPAVHPLRLHRRTHHARGAGPCRQPGGRGSRRRLGRGPPQAPPVLGRRRRPALAVGVRPGHARPDPGLHPRARRMALHLHGHRHREVRPRPHRRPGDRPDLAALAPHRRDQHGGPDGDRVRRRRVGGRGPRVLLGHPRPRGAGPPHDVVDQLGLPRVGRTPLQHPGSQRERGVAGARLRRGVVAQLPPCRPVERTAWGAPPAARHVRHRHSRARAPRPRHRP